MNIKIRNKFSLIKFLQKHKKKSVFVIYIVLKIEIYENQKKGKKFIWHILIGLANISHFLKE